MKGNDKSIIEDILNSVGLESLAPARKRESPPALLPKKPASASTACLARPREFGIHYNRRPCLLKEH